MGLEPSFARRPPEKPGKETANFHSAYGSGGSGDSP